MARKKKRNKKKQSKGEEKESGIWEGEKERGGSLPNSLLLIFLNLGLQLFFELMKDSSLPPSLQS